LPLFEVATARPLTMNDISIGLVKRLLGLDGFRVLEHEVPEIVSLSNTLARSWAEILAHHDTGASNGATEGLKVREEGEVLRAWLPQLRALRATRASTPGVLPGRAVLDRRHPNVRSLVKTRVRALFHVVSHRFSALGCTEVRPPKTIVCHKRLDSGSVDGLVQAGAEITRVGLQALLATTLGLAALILVVGLVLGGLSRVLGCSVQEAANGVATVLGAIRRDRTRQ
jgi:hypothetical protein